MQPTDRLPATIFDLAGGAARPTDRAVAVEVPVNIVYGTVAYAVMMMSPTDLEDFARGFSLTEGVIEAAADIRRVTTETAEGGLRVVVDLAPERFHRLLARRRSMSGRTSCGVCGIEELGALPRATVRAPGWATATVTLAAIRRALEALPGHQVVNAEAKAVHAAAWAAPDGSILCVREDVGRHNALDKLVGALLARGTQPADGFVVVTSRCSFEMLEKVAALGAPTLVAISAPTTLGVARAREHGITLVAALRGDTITAFAGAERVVG